MERPSKRAAGVLSIAALVALMLLLSVGIYTWFLAPSGPILSEEENRMLADKPAFTLSGFLDGSFADGMEQYLSDRFPLRAKIIPFTQELRQVGSLASFEDYARIAEGDDVAVMEYGDELQNGEEDVIVTPRPTRTPAPTNAPTPTAAPTDTPEPTAVPTDTLTPTPAGTPEPVAETAEPVTMNEQTASPVEMPAPTAAPTDTPAPTSTPEPTATPVPTKAPVNLDDWPKDLRFYLIDGEKKSAAVTRRRSDLVNQAKLFDAYASLLPEDGRFVMTIVPVSTRAARLRSYADPKGMTSEIEPFLHAITGNNVSVISAVDLLSEPLLNGEYVYFRTDRHWTPYGAHIVISRLLQEVGETLPPYTYFPKRQEYPFLGTIYRDTRNKNLEKDPDTLDLLTPTHPVSVRRYSRPTVFEEISFLDEDAKPQDRYACYLGGPHGQLTVIERTDVAAGVPLKTCFMITDSYGLCTTPYFMEVYDRVIVYDPRYYDKPIMGALSDVIESYGVKDIFLVAGEVDVYDPPYLQLINRHF